MRAGDLRHRITLQKRDAGVDSLSNPLLTWSNFATVWADIAPMSGREMLAAAAVHVSVSHIVTIRYQSQFSDVRAMAAMRIMYGTRVFNINSSLDMDERHRTIELTCNEGLTDG